MRGGDFSAINRSGAGGYGARAGGRRAVTVLRACDFSAKNRGRADGEVARRFGAGGLAVVLRRGGFAAKDRGAPVGAGGGFSQKIRVWR